MQTQAEALFNDNVEYNTLLSGRNAKPKIKNIGRIFKEVFINVTTDEVLSSLEHSGLVISLKTLQRYRKAGVIPEPKIIGRGNKAGKAADWPNETPAHTYAAYKLINGQGDDEGFKVNPQGVAKARADALGAIGTNATNLWITSIVWLRLVCKYYGDDAEYPEVRFLKDLDAKNVEIYRQQWSPEAIPKRKAEQETGLKALLDRFEKSKNMTPEEKAQQNAKDREEFEEFKRQREESKIKDNVRPL